MKPLPLRVLHCPDAVGGHAPQLARAERALGAHSWSVAFQPSPYAYEVDETIAAPDDRVLTLERKRVRLLWRALRDFDVVHFNFGASLFPWAGPKPRAPRPLKPLLLWLYQSAFHLRDVALLKRAGKKIFVTYQGDDARQADYSRANFPIHFVNEVGPEHYPPGSDERKRAAISLFDRYADGIYALNPDLLYVLPARARFVPYASVDLGEWRPTPAADTQGPLRIVHAPSSRGVKGTRYLVEAVTRLRSNGVALELLLVENMSRGAARALYEKADLAVDQLLAGWYGGFAVEAMALGKPVVAYIREPDLAFLPQAMREELPVINAHPGSIAAVLEEIARKGRAFLAAAGARARAYVQRWHDPASVAAVLLADYRTALGRP